MDKCNCENRCRHYIENSDKIYIVYCYQMNAVDLKKNKAKWNRLKKDNQINFDNQKIFYVGATSHSLEVRIKQHKDLTCKKTTPKKWGEYLIGGTHQLLQQYPCTIDESDRATEEKKWGNNLRAEGYWVYQK